MSFYVLPTDERRAEASVFHVLDIKMRWPSLQRGYLQVCVSTVASCVCVFTGAPRSHKCWKLPRVDLHVTVCRGDLGRALL